MMRKNVAVVGTVFVDVKGFPQNQYDPRGRNIGQVRFFHGGVGRNVAETMALLGTSTHFVSTVDQTALAEEVLERLGKSGVHTDFVSKTPQGMGMWLAILDENGDLAGSISQMPNTHEMEQAILNKIDVIMDQAEALALELDLNEAMAERFVEAATQKDIPIYIIPGNLSVLANRGDLLSQCEGLICNEVEAEKLTGISCLGDENVPLAARKLLEFGLNQVVITLGERGSYFIDSTTASYGFTGIRETKLVDSTGAGDSFFAGTVSAILQGLGLKEATQLGAAVAAITISVDESTCLDLQQRLEGLAPELTRLITHNQ